jgi:diphthine synthase
MHSHFQLPLRKPFIVSRVSSPMLYVIGLGLHGDLTLEGCTIAQMCTVYIEAYTSVLTISLQKLEHILKRKITILTRKDVEETQYFLEEAKTSNVALLVVGDPLVATTHIEILLEAHKQNIKTKIIHNSSVYSAIAETGLQIYKFGKTATIPFPEKGFKPTSFYQVLQENKKIGAHTLMLLDIQADKKKYMNPKQAMEILYNLGYCQKIVCVSRLGCSTQNVVYGHIKDLLEFTEKYWGGPPHCVVIPGVLHFKEEEALEFYKVIP